MFEYPSARAAAIAKPSAELFPRPLAAVKVTVEDNVFSAIASMNVRIACAWSRDLASLTRSPAGLVSDSEDRISFSSSSAFFSWADWADASSMGLISFPRDIGRTFSSSSRNRQSAEAPRERMKRSLNRATTESCEEVR